MTCDLDVPALARGGLHGMHDLQYVVGQLAIGAMGPVRISL